MADLPTKIYLVVGYAGAYSDSSMWNVGWYSTNEEAQRCVQVLDLLMPEVRKTYDRSDLTYEQKERLMMQLISPFDPNGGVEPSASYSVEEVNTGPNTTNLDLTPEKISMLSQVFKL